MFSESWPMLVNKFTALLNQTIAWASGYFDINQQQIQEWIIKTKGELIDTISSSIGHTLAHHWQRTCGNVSDSRLYLYDTILQTTYT